MNSITECGHAVPPLYQRAAGVVANAAKHACADAGGADEGMRLSAQRIQQLLQLAQCGARKTYDLLAAIYDMHFLHPARVEDENAVVVIMTIGRGAACQAGIRRLHDQNLIHKDTYTPRIPPV